MNDSTLRKLKALIRPGIIGGIIVLVSLFVSFQSYFSQKEKIGQETGYRHTYYNNYLIFKNSYHHLSENKNLYSPYAREYYDLYKYSPTFAFLMAPFAWIPELPGLIIWDLLNALVLFLALWKMPFRSVRYRIIAIAFIAIELLTSVQNHQSNGLIAGLILFSFLAMENKKTALASLLIVLTVFIKLFGVIALTLFIFYPDRLKTAAYTLGWIILLGLAPLILVPWDTLVNYYQEWALLIRADAGNYSNLSVMSWLQSWFGLSLPKISILLPGILLFLLPLTRIRLYPDPGYRLLFLSSTLVWMVIFNHMAESPTFIIAVAGIAVWLFNRPLNRWNLLILILVIIFTILSPTDLYPRMLSIYFAQPYVVKVVPCILAWLKITYDMLCYRHETKMVTVSD